MYIFCEEKKRSLYNRCSGDLKTLRVKDVYGRRRKTISKEGSKALGNV